MDDTASFMEVWKMFKTVNGNNHQLTRDLLASSEGNYPHTILSSKVF